MYCYLLWFLYLYICTVWMAVMQSFWTYFICYFINNHCTALCKWLIRGINVLIMIKCFWIHRRGDLWNWVKWGSAQSLKKHFISILFSWIPTINSSIYCICQKPKIIKFSFWLNNVYELSIIKCIVLTVPIEIKVIRIEQRFSLLCSKVTFVKI